MARGTSPASSAASVGEEVRVSTLPSGVRIVTERMPSVRSVTVGFWVNAGSRDERDEVAGASHFLEHLLFKGTKRRSAQQIAEEIDAVGGDLNAFTSKEYTCFYARCLDRDLALAVDVLGDLFANALVRAGDVDAERNVVLEEIHMHQDTPDDLVHSVFSEAFFGDHPLGREVLGSEATIGAMRRDQVHGYYKRRYIPDSTVVAAAGNLHHDAFVALVAEALEGWTEPPRAARPNRRPPAGAPGAQVVVRKRPTEQAHLVFGGQGLARGDERRYAAGVLNQALGGGMASRLFQEVRERRGLVYSVYSYHGQHNDAGSYAVYGGTTPRKAIEVVEVVRAEFAKLLDTGLPADELARAKSHIAGAIVLALEDTGSRMNRLGKSLVTGSPLLSLDETIAAIEAVTEQDVRGVAEVLLGGPFTLAVVGPFDAAQRRRLDKLVRAA